MRRSAKLSLWVVVSVMIALVACTSAATPVPPTPTNLPPTNIIAPPATPLPTSTPQPPYRSLPDAQAQHRRKNVRCRRAQDESPSNATACGSPTVVIEPAHLFLPSRSGLGQCSFPTSLRKLAFVFTIASTTGPAIRSARTRLNKPPVSAHALMQAAKIEPPYIVAAPLNLVVSLR